ncbi:MbeD family mobilization/exclusion protein [Enterobacter hormaechei]|uniref:MbeD family mobilization/exclusion protein n=1 Tax=Enterobacter hormaechei TaxID=158836 RepID=UPI003743A66B
MNRAGKTVAERIRAATAGLLEKADEWENAFAEWRTMSGLMQRENAALSERVTGLSRQVQSLSEQLRRLSQG